MMNKTIIMTMALTLAALAGQAKVIKTISHPTATVCLNVRQGELRANEVIMTDTATTVRFTIEYQYPVGASFRFVSSSYLADRAGNRYPLRAAEGIKLDDWVNSPADGKTDFTMHFEPLPAEVQIFDFIEGDVEGAFRLIGIHDDGYLPEGITDTYWRDDATGDWLIGFTASHVIYGNRVHEIASRTERKDTYTLTTADGETIRVGRLRKGLRTITIGSAAPAVCSPITTATLPDYPTKDLRVGFRDNGYRQGDSVTLVGWLKDMPEALWKKGSEFEVSLEDIIKDTPENAYAKMDSLGRFSLRFPLLNTSQVFMDWGRTTICTVMEPGETYFLLYDHKTGQQLFMGTDVRVQNELLAHSLSMGDFSFTPDDRGKTTAMAFLERTDSARNSQMAELRERIGQHPNLSQRYVDYLSGYILTLQGEGLMQARFYMPNTDLPQPYMDYVGRELWQKLSRPYTLYGCFSTFMRDYLDQLHHNEAMILRGDETVDMVRRLEQQGIVTLTADEQQQLDAYEPLMNKLVADLSGNPGREKIDSLVKAFNANEVVQKVSKLMVRIGAPLQDELDAYAFRRHLAHLDSVGCDRPLRDIYLARLAHREFKATHEPLRPGVMAFVSRELQTPAALASVQAEHDKYLALQRRDITKTESLKSNDNVAEMTEGEQILRKITEPYRGRLVLLDIWGTWCVPCVEALSQSKEEYERLKDYDLVYLYLANRSSDQSWKNVIKEYDLVGDNIVHYNLPDSQQSAIEHFLKVNAFPTYRLIDRDGTLLDVDVDPRYLESLVNLLEKMK